MNQFKEAYRDALSKNLKRVRLKIDPKIKEAQDFSQYNGYEGYILGETDQFVRFFVIKTDKIIKIPRIVAEAVKKHNWFDRFAQGTGSSTLQNAAQGNWAGAAGNLAGKAAGALAGIGRAAIGLQQPVQKDREIRDTTPTIRLPDNTIAHNVPYSITGTAGALSFMNSDGETFYIVSIYKVDTKSDKSNVPIVPPLQGGSLNTTELKQFENDSQKGQMKAVVQNAESTMTGVEKIKFRVIPASSANAEYIEGTFVQ